MNEPTDLEHLLLQQIPSLPVDHRDLVVATIAANVRRQTLIDDLRRMSICVSILAVAILFHWALVRSTNQQAQKLSTKALVIAEDGRHVARFLSSSMGRQPVWENGVSGHLPSTN